MKPKKAKLFLSDKDKKRLENIAVDPTASPSKIQRAEILLLYAKGEKIVKITELVRGSRTLVYRTIDKALEFGAIQSLADLRRTGRSRKINDGARQWILSIAGQKPTAFGYNAKTWTYTRLVQHIQNNSATYGHHCLRKISRSQVHDILNKNDNEPHRTNYYPQRRTTRNEEKSANILHVYKNLQIVEPFSGNEKEQNNPTNGADQQPSVPVTILGGIDLHTGKIHVFICDKHGSNEFIRLLKIIDKNYPEDWIIRVVLDNHSSHLSKATRTYLKTRPNRFHFVFTPKHGSWLNLIESMFNKTTDSLLQHTKTQTKDELISNIYQVIEAINQSPTTHRRQYTASDTTII